VSAGRGLPAGTLTFLFTDIEGSTKLQSGLGTDRYQDVLETHTRILRDAFQGGGFEVRVEGDALFVVFPVAAKAVRATAAAQRALAVTSFPHGATVRAHGHAHRRGPPRDSRRGRRLRRDRCEPRGARGRRGSRRPGVADRSNGDPGASGSWRRRIDPRPR